MALTDFVLPTEEVSFPGGSFAVRGLSLEDITVLLTTHGPVMEQFFKKYSGSPEESSPMEIGMSLVAQAPTVAAQIIALAADEPEKADVIRKMNLAVQQKALEKIAKLTFDASGGPGKFVEAVIRLVQGTTNLMGSLQR